MTKRAVCLNCMDGRVQLPVIDWIKNNYTVDYVDMITEPGINGLLADSTHDMADITKKINISIKKNQAAMIFVVGHHDCKGNPVDESTHKEQILMSVERLKKEFTGIDIKGIWVNNKWQVEESEKE